MNEREDEVRMIIEKCNAYTPEPQYNDYCVVYFSGQCKMLHCKCDGKGNKKPYTVDYKLLGIPRRGLPDELYYSDRRERVK